MNDIINEFYIYKEKTEVKNDNYDFNKLFSVVIYKLILPLEFSKEILGKGLISNLVNQFKTNALQNEISQNLTSKKNHIEYEARASRSKLTENAYDLLMSFKNNHKSYSGRNLCVNQKRISKEDDLKDLVINDESKITFENIPDYFITWRELENMHGTNLLDYVNKVNKIEKNRILKIINLKEIEDNLYDKKLSFIFSYIINENLTHNIAHDFLSETDEMSIINYFLINGYIDETYFDYISQMHENTLFPLSDRKYLMALRSGIKTKSIHSMMIENPETLLRKLYEKDYIRTGILNAKLFEWAANSNFEKDISVFKKIINEKIKIDAYEEFKPLFLSFDSNTESYKSLITLVLTIIEENYNLDVFNELVDIFESDKINEYFTLPILKYKPFKKGFLPDLKKLENPQPILMLINEDNYKSICDSMVYYGFKFIKTINKSKLNDNQQKFLTKLIENKLIDVGTIPFLLNTIYDFEMDEIRKKAISILFNNKDLLKEICEVAYENFNELLEVILLDTSERYEDDEDAIFHMLDSLDKSLIPVDNQLLSKYLTNQRKKIKDISKLSSDGNIYIFLKLNTLESNYNNLVNIIELHDELKSDTDYSDPLDGYTYFEALTDFINIEENFMELAKSTVSYTSILENFFFKNKNLDTKVLVTILPKINFTDDDKNNFSKNKFIESINASIVQLLISQNLVNLNNETASYIFSNLNEFDIDIIKNWIFSYKTEFINNIEMYFSLDIEDLNDYLLGMLISFSNLQENEKIAIYKHLIQIDLIEAKQEILLDALSLAYNKKLVLEDEIVVSGMKKIKDRSKIINYTIKFQTQLTNNSLQEIYQKFPDEQLQKISKPLTRISIENTDINKQFLNLLKDKKIISSIKEKGDNIIGNRTAS